MLSVPLPNLDRVLPLEAQAQLPDRYRRLPVPLENQRPAPHFGIPLHFDALAGSGSVPRQSTQTHRESPGAAPRPIPAGSCVIVVPTGLRVSCVRLLFFRPVFVGRHWYPDRHVLSLSAPVWFPSPRSQIATGDCHVPGNSHLVLF